MLKINSLTKTFNKNTPDEKKVLDNFNLYLKSGEFVTIIGGNGAGKSTLFNSIAGSTLPDGGSILLDGMNITYEPEHKRASYIGRIFQDPLKGTAPNMTIEENLSMAYMRSKKMHPLNRIPNSARNFIRERISELNLGLEDRMNTKVGLLSGGQRQAITLVMATLSVPKLLLLDEHTAALDPVSSEKVMELTDKIVNENNITTLMITHNISSALKNGNRTIMLNKGSIAIDISGEERKNMSVIGLIDMFNHNTSSTFDCDEALL